MEDKLTVLEALKWTFIIWRDVAASYYDENGEFNPKKMEDKNKICSRYKKVFVHDCPCCQWMKDNHTEYKYVFEWCDNTLCLMKEVWGAKEDRRGIACEYSSTSPYAAFIYADSFKESADAAEKIAEGAWSLYLDECERLNVPAGNKHLLPYDKKLDIHV